jgi:hypothetical protein
MLTTPIIGLAMAASSSPMARMKARCGARSSPSVVTRDRNFFIFTVPRQSLGRAQIGARVSRHRGTIQLIAVLTSRPAATRACVFEPVAAATDARFKKEWAAAWPPTFNRPATQNDHPSYEKRAVACN